MNIMNAETKALLALSFALLFSLFAMPAHAVQYTLTVEPAFDVGETVKFFYSITSTTDESVTFTPRVLCPKGPGDMSDALTVDVGPTTPYSGEHRFLTVDDTVESQQCAALLIVTAPTERTLRENFTIFGMPRVHLNVNACSDAACNQPSRVFRTGTPVFFIASAVDDYGVELTPIFFATLTSSNGSEQRVVFSRVGNLTLTPARDSYILVVQASLAGYITDTQSLQFAVADTVPPVTDASRCNANGVCDADETPQLCPQDCGGGQPVTPMPGDYTSLALIVVVVLVFAGAYYFLVHARGTKKK